MVAIGLLAVSELPRVASYNNRQIRPNQIRLSDQIRHPVKSACQHIKPSLWSKHLICCNFIVLCVSLLKCNILLLGKLILLLHCVFRIEHHSMFRTVNCIYYIIYLRPIVGRVYFCEDLVLLQPYFQLRKNEIISIYYLFYRNHELAPSNNIIITMTRYYNFRLISISSTSLN